MPDPFNQFLVVCHYCAQFSQRTGIEAIAVSQVNGWHQPKFGLTVAVSYVNMHAFAWIAFIGVEEEPERPVSEYYWHNSSLALVGRKRKADRCIMRARG